VSWRWMPTSGADVPAIVELAVNHFQVEIDTVFTPDPIAYARNLTMATVAQYYNPGSELLKVAKDDATNAIIAYVWVMRNQRAPWSDQEMATVRMVHVDLALSLRDRLRLVQEMLLSWEDWARTYSIPIICSTTMRRETAGFLKLHQRNGYDVRGSFAYKKLN